jgi:hypothetical protein
MSAQQISSLKEKNSEKSLFLALASLDKPMVK